jgi:hypothetical protein
MMLPIPENLGSLVGFQVAAYRETAGTISVTSERGTFGRSPAELAVVINCPLLVLTNYSG